MLNDAGFIREPDALNAADRERFSQALEDARLIPYPLASLRILPAPNVQQDNASTPGASSIEFRQTTCQAPCRPFRGPNRARATTLGR